MSVRELPIGILSKEYVSLNSESKVMSDDYKNMYQRLLFECSCGDTFNTTLLNFKESGKKRCGRCTGLTSNSELAVQEYLKDNSIDFISEYRFQDCRGAVNPLPFDFAVLNNEGNVKLLIEADGEGHYRPVNFGGCSDKTALKLFERTVRYDKIKTAYCKNNKIKLIRIPYWEFKNIDNYLKNAMP